METTTNNSTKVKAFGIPELFMGFSFSVGITAGKKKRALSHKSNNQKRMDCAYLSA